VASTSDDNLVARVLAGDLDAFAEIVQRHEDLVWRVAAALLGDRVATENITQQCFVNAYQRLHQFQAGRDLGHWLKGIARHLSHDELRRWRRESNHLSAYRDYLIARQDRDDATEEVAALERAVAACRERLGPTSARALAMRYEQALDLESIAKALGRSLAATRQLLFRTREALRLCVQKRLETE
jgi:RNA polymerase sigma-70 factor, ECF subfamily